MPFDVMQRHDILVADLLDFVCLLAAQLALYGIGPCCRQILQRGGFFRHVIIQEGGAGYKEYNY
jgi:hypothetical protein